MHTARTIDLDTKTYTHMAYEQKNIEHRLTCIHTHKHTHTHTHTIRPNPRWRRNLLQIVVAAGAAVAAA
jgi:hypothetical protein